MCIRDRNISVWNRSICGNWIYRGSSPLCIRCWHARGDALWPGQPRHWERSSELADSFHRPLGSAIRQFPVPAPNQTKSGVVYSQRFVCTKPAESVLFWCIDSAELLATFGPYCHQHDLSIEFYRAPSMPNQVCVTIATKPNAP